MYKTAFRCACALWKVAWGSFRIARLHSLHDFLAHQLGGQLDVCIKVATSLVHLCPFCTHELLMQALRIRGKC